MGPGEAQPGGYYCASEYASAGIYIPHSWSEAVNYIADGPSSSRPPITAVCGPKNSGKSTFSRLLVNTLLQSHKNVAYLDTDVGQPEFTAPGCLSLHLLHEQITDFAAMSMKTPVKCIFYGDISSKRDPKTYLRGIFTLYDYFISINSAGALDKQREKMLPLVINTPGWVKGAGYEVLVEMLKYLAPTHVVQIRVSLESKNLPYEAFWLDKDQYEEANVDLMYIYAARKDAYNRSILTHKQAHDLRDIRIIAYFQQCIPTYMEIITRKELAHALTSITPYEVPLSGIKVKHLYCQVPSSEVFHSLNATIVGLAVSSGGNAEVENGLPWCVGLGIVRGIDISKGVLYIITPVPPKNLEDVDLLLQGFIEIPMSLLQVQGCMSPYVSSNVLNKLDPSVIQQADLEKVPSGFFSDL